MSSTAVCGYLEANWEINSSGETPCQVYADLQGKCNPAFTIQSVTSTSPAYTPPNNGCGCNIVAYNLMGACAWCQTGILISWWLPIDQWVGNCTQAQFNPSAIPPTVQTAGINFPAWAFVIPSGTTWSPSQASLAAVSATPSLSTARPTTSATGTGSDFTSSRPSTTRPSGDGPTDLTGAVMSAGTTAGIALGVIIGLWALSLIVIAVVFVRRRSQRQAWYGPMAAFYRGQKGGGYGGYTQYPPPSGAGAPLVYPTGSPHGDGNPTGHPFSNPHIIPTGGYQPPPAEANGVYPAGAPPAGHTAPYVPPPPETSHGFQSPQGAGGWGGASPGNTASMYGGSGSWGAASAYGPNTASMYGSQTALGANSGIGGVAGTGHGGAPPGGVPPGPGGHGYRGHAEIY